MSFWNHEAKVKGILVWVRVARVEKSEKMKVIIKF